MVGGDGDDDDDGDGGDDDDDDDDDDKVESVVAFDAPRLLDVDGPFSSSRSGLITMSWYIRRRAIARSGPRAACNPKERKKSTTCIPHRDSLQN